MEGKGIELPPGFRFHPTNEEIITHYLLPKILDHSFTAVAIAEVDLNKCEPWDLPSKAKMGGNEMYFFSHRDKKYPTGMRTNRATEFGYWKATGKDKEIHQGRGALVGTKKTLVFYKGRAPKGERTNWVMHEFKHQSKDEWVVCRVLYKNEKPQRIQCFRDELMIPSYDFRVNLLLPSPPPPPPSLAMNFSAELASDEIDRQLLMSLQDQSSYYSLLCDEAAVLRDLATTSNSSASSSNTKYYHHEEYWKSNQF